MTPYRRTARRGFTLAETLVALTVNSIIMIAGVMMLRGIMAATSANMDRTLATGEVQDIGQVLEPLVQEAGTGLPIDRGFAPVGFEVSTGIRKVHVLVRDTLNPIMQGYRCTDATNVPTTGCIAINAPSVTPYADANVLIVSGSSGAVRFIKVATATATPDGRVKLTWDTALANFGWPAAGTAVAGESGRYLIPVSRSTITWRSTSKMATVADGVVGDVVATQWTLATGLTEFMPSLLYLGSVAGGMPTMSGRSFANNITALRIRYAQDAVVRGVPRRYRRVLTVAPTALIQ